MVKALKKPTWYAYSLRLLLLLGAEDNEDNDDDDLAAVVVEEVVVVGAVVGAFVALIAVVSAVIFIDDVSIELESPSILVDVVAVRAVVRAVVVVVVVGIRSELDPALGTYGTVGMAPDRRRFRRIFSGVLCCLTRE